MAAWTLEEARQNLKTWLDAEMAVATGQEYTIGGRTLKRANLGLVASRVSFWKKEVEKLEAGVRGARVIGVVPRDF